MDNFNSDFNFNTKRGGLKVIGSHKTTITSENFGSASVTSVCYHNTAVIKFDEHNIKLNTGGWFTPTTKKRMNQASQQYGLNFYVFQKDYSWFCNYENKIFSFTGNELILPR